VTNLFFLNDAIEHNDSSAVLFPYHQPEVTTRLFQRTLQEKRHTFTEKYIKNRKYDNHKVQIHGNINLT